MTMRKFTTALCALATVGSLAAAAAPADAQGYYYHHSYRHDCYRAKRHAGNQGTALGAVSGGVLGGVIGHSVVGGLVGAGVGAVAGHAIAKSRVRC
jgi:hypothetical protein